MAAVNYFCPRYRWHHDNWILLGTSRSQVPINFEERKSDLVHFPLASSETDMQRYFTVSVYGVLQPVVRHVPRNTKVSINHFEWLFYIWNVYFSNEALRNRKIILNSFHLLLQQMIRILPASMRYSFNINNIVNCIYLVHIPIIPCTLHRNV